MIDFYLLGVFFVIDLFNNINTYRVFCIRYTIHSEHMQFYSLKKFIQNFE